MTGGDDPREWLAGPAWIEDGPPTDEDRRESAMADWDSDAGSEVFAELDDLREQSAEGAEAKAKLQEVEAQLKKVRAQQKRLTTEKRQLQKLAERGEKADNSLAKAQHAANANRAAEARQTEERWRQTLKRAGYLPLGRGHEHTVKDAAMLLAEMYKLEPDKVWNKLRKMRRRGVL